MTFSEEVLVRCNELNSELTLLWDGLPSDPEQRAIVLEKQSAALNRIAEIAEVLQQAAQIEKRRYRP